MGLYFLGIISHNHLTENIGKSRLIINKKALSSQFKAILLSVLAGVPTVLGAIIGYLLGVFSPVWLALSLTFASGAMLYAVFGELIPESILMYRSKLPALAILVGFLLGIILVFM